MIPDPIRAPLLTGLPHAFLGRAGGMSGGQFATLNAGLGSSDDPAAIAENRSRAVAAVAPGHALVTLRQIHSARAVAIASPVVDGAYPEADALATATPGLLLGILTADCAPVLMADTAAGVVGAAHAGWKGALGGVTDSCVGAMETLGARRERIVAAIGPCIARASYEVDAGFFRRFAAADPANERFFADGVMAGHHQFDLEAYVAHRLARAGVMRIATLGLDTYTDQQCFFSYRRATHRGETDYGRQLSMIGLPG